MNWQKDLKCKAKQREPLSKHTTIKIGGNARFFFEPCGLDDLKSLIKALKRYKIPILILGAGSNILAPDSGVDAAVIKLSSGYFRNASLDGNCINVAAGMPLSRMINFAYLNSLSGIEFLSGIPGTLGGALAMNAGTKDRDISETVVSVTVLDYNNKIRVLKKKEIAFGYRKSSLSKYIILGARIRLKKSRKGLIKNNIAGYLTIRRKSQDYSKPSAGCIFKNPPGLSAGKLIDMCGLKGVNIGDAFVSSVHANFILNAGAATFKDVTALINLVKKEVNRRFKVRLEPEVKILK
ncbi:MAG: UDP-N-acetylmuramate dehydrogenase [Candidatus Omnitrophota bacterium]|jgi:UDP-N-acetylmuramate dehydrogenase|nr:MAG: UDP-N-acetylmuramate dehydrogenase [Candidatus Omnitrophota bacterium]